MNSLNGKVALVTGAAARRGMGHGVALRLAGEGADVVMVDQYATPRSLFSEDKGWEGLNSVVTEVEAKGRKGLAVVADISKEQEVDAAVAKALERFGRVDMLVHCAAIRGPMTTPLVELSGGGLEDSSGGQSHGCLFDFQSGSQQYDRQGRRRQDRPGIVTSGE